MKATGPHYDERKKLLRRKPWNLGGLKKAVKNPDGTDKLDARGAVIFRRYRPYFWSEKEAKAEKDRLNEQQESTGSTDLELVLNRDQIGDYASAKKIIGEVSLESVARFWRLHHPAEKTATCAVLIDDFLASIQTKLVSDTTDRNRRVKIKPKKVRVSRHVSDLISRLGAFKASPYGLRYPKTISHKDILAYINGLKDRPGGGLMARTRWNHKNNLGIFFAYLLRQDLVDANPVAGIEMKEIGAITHPEPIPLTLEHATRYLRALERYDRDLVAHEIIQLLAGVRSDEEMSDFRAEFVYPQAGEVKVPEDIAKTEKRIVLSDLEDNFWAWWAIYGRSEGLLRPSNYDPRWNRVRVLASVSDSGVADSWASLPIKTLLKKPEAKKALKAWPWNARRRTFTSYHVAKHQSAGKTALILRHEGPTSTLHQSYRGLGITQKMGIDYFNILPVPQEIEIRPIIEPKGIVKRQRDARLLKTVPIAAEKSLSPASTGL